MLDLKPEACEALYHVAYQHYRSGKFADAEAIFGFLTTCAALEPKYWVGLAGSRQMQKNYKKAIDAYQIAFDLKPKDPKISFHAAECYLALGDTKEGIFALECAERAANLAKEPDTNLLAHIGLVKQAWSNNN